MRFRPIVRSLAAATVVSLGVAAPAAAQENPLSDILAPVVDLLRHGGDGPDNSGPGNAGDRENPPPPTAPAPPLATTTPAPTATPDPTAPAPPVAAPPARPRSPVALRYLVGRHLLRPGPGTVLGGLQPTLRWRGGPAGVDLYNVQIFSATGAKVMSAFPARRTFRIPPKRLAPGRRYLWRVWPYTRANGYTKRALALSWFATPSRTVLAAH
jgi:hypothetical protein